MSHENRGQGDEHDRHAYAHEYRSLLKSVIKEVLHDQDALIAKLFKDAVKEWLTEKSHDTSALLVKLLALVVFFATVWIVIKPK